MPFISRASRYFEEHRGGETETGLDQLAPQFGAPLSTLSFLTNLDWRVDGRIEDGATIRWRSSVGFSSNWSELLFVMQGKVLPARRRLISVQFSLDWSGLPLAWFLMVFFFQVSSEYWLPPPESDNRLSKAAFPWRVGLPSSCATGPSRGFVLLSERSLHRQGCPWQVYCLVTETST